MKPSMWNPDRASVIGLVWLAAFYATLAVFILMGFFGMAHPSHSLLAKGVLTLLVGGVFACAPALGVFMCVLELRDRLKKGTLGERIAPTFEEWLIFVAHAALVSGLLLYFGPSKIAAWLQL